MKDFETADSAAKIYDLIIKMPLMMYLFNINKRYIIRGIFIIKSIDVDDIQNLEIVKNDSYLKRNINNYFQKRYISFGIYTKCY
ncbi:MAG: hypothetical protein RCG16_06855 [Rickettsia hoogstraalii]